METNIAVEVVKDKSFDPSFLVKVSYDDGKTKFVKEEFSVSRKPPKVHIEYPEQLKKILEKTDTQQIELEIMRAIVEFLLNSTGKRR